MSTSITQVDGKLTIKDAEFIRVTMPDNTVYAFSSSFRNEVINNTVFSGTYTALGGLLSVSGHQRDLSVTSYDTTVSLVGVDKTQIGAILTANVKGAKIEIWRGFYNDTYELDGTPVLRYTGIVTGYVIDENYGELSDTFMLSLHCSSYKRVLETRLSGRFTNKSSWRSVNSTDAGMDNVAAINGAKFNFGQKLA
jgi:hypothetical protein